ncbi:hypothetical protein HC823_00380 [Candidatus Gracilibacteria bacterium]|nr:hypothetical protein [Candidatus Gracilibacteria bacterium]
MTVAILQSVSKSLEQSQNLERSNQVFLAAESGLEAAFFHHNARGQGVDLETGLWPTIHKKIFQSEIGAEVSWTIQNRRHPIVGVIHESEKISIPFFWDNAAHAGEDPDETESTQGFTLTFARNRYDNAGNNTGEVLVPAGFDFGNSDVGENEPLFAWSLSRVNSAEGIQSLIASPDPLYPQVPCEGDTSFLCKDSFPGAISTSGVDLYGNVVPGDTQDNLNNFLTDGSSGNYRFSFQPLLSFTNEAGDTTIEGIPYKIEFVGGTSVPAQNYTATAKVDVADFSKTISVTIPEKQSIGAFDYLVFD